MLIEAFVSKLPVETLDIGVLDRLPRLNKPELELASGWEIFSCLVQLYIHISHKNIVLNCLPPFGANHHLDNICVPEYGLVYLCYSCNHNYHTYRVQN